MIADLGAEISNLQLIKCKVTRISDPLFEEFGDGFKVTIFRKVSNKDENVGTSDEKISNAFKKVSNGDAKVGNASWKMGNSFEHYRELLSKAGITDKFIENIQAVYEKNIDNKPFGQGNVQKWLDCSKSKATNVMNAMKKAEVICKVTGMGAGKYEFVER